MAPGMTGGAFLAVSGFAARGWGRFLAVGQGRRGGHGEIVLYVMLGA
jgi:hypothetical protein